MEAASALDYRFVKGNGTIIQFREVVGSMQTSLVYPNQEFEQLQNALAAHNEQSVRCAVQNIIQFMEQKRLPLYLARSICFDLLHMVSEQSRNGYDFSLPSGTIRTRNRSGNYRAIKKME